MRASRGRVWLLASSFALVACSGTSSSAYRTSGGPSAPYAGVVRIYSTSVPPEAQQLGVVQVDSVEHIESAVAEFQRRVAELGGDVGVIDRYSTSFELVSRTRTESYNCGTIQSPRTCTRSVTTRDEVATLHLLGRAMTTTGAR